MRRLEHDLEREGPRLRQRPSVCQYLKVIPKCGTVNIFSLQCFLICSLVFSILTFIHSFKPFAKWVSGFVLGSVDTILIKTYKNVCIHGVCILGVEEKQWPIKKQSDNNFFIFDQILTLRLLAYYPLNTLNPSGSWTQLVLLLSIVCYICFVYGSRIEY